MKKQRLLAFLMTAVMLILTGCECKHEHWNEATCSLPRTCADCGLTEGEPLGHDWTEANCTDPKTCKTCGATEGQAYGHQFDSATCDKPRTCIVCGATEGEPTGHVWIEATCAAPRTCAVCGLVEGQPTGQHDWIEATCDEAKTCRVCGAVEGTALGHDWQAATLNMPAQCKRCGQYGASALTYTYLGTGTVKLDIEANFYKEANAESEVLGLVPGGTVLKCYEAPNAQLWYCINYNNVTGFIPRSSMSTLTDIPSSQPHSNPNTFDITSISNANIGDKVKFGNYTQNSDFITKAKTPVEWIVLAKDSTKMLLLADRSVECLPYHNSKTTVAWEESSLCKWMNNDFYNAAFSAQEKRYIVTNNVSDKPVFALSYNEFNQYVNPIRAGKTTITYFGYWHRSAGGLLKGINSAWWLRDAGDKEATAYTINTDGNPIVNDCDNVNEKRDARPAIWVSLF